MIASDKNSDSLLTTSTYIFAFSFFLAPSDWPTNEVQADAVPSPTVKARPEICCTIWFVAYADVPTPAISLPFSRNPTRRNTDSAIVPLPTCIRELTVALSNENLVNGLRER